MPANRIFIFSPFFSIKIICISNSFTKSSIITNTTIWLFEYISFTSVLTSTIKTYSTPFIVSKTKRRNNIKITKFLTNSISKNSRTTRIIMRRKYSNSFKNLLIYPIIWTTFSFTISSKFKFFYCMLTNIRISNNII